MPEEREKFKNMNRDQLVEGAKEYLRKITDKGRDADHPVKKLLETYVPEFGGTPIQRSKSKTHPNINTFI